MRWNLVVHLDEPPLSLVQGNDQVRPLCFQQNGGPSGPPRAICTGQKLRQHVSHHWMTVFFAPASPGSAGQRRHRRIQRLLFAIQWRWNKLMRKAALLTVALLGINLLIRGASVYTDRIDDPSAVYLTQSAFGVHADGTSDDTAEI